jgi:hypothetical protein
MKVSTTKEHPYLVTLHPETFEEEQLLRNFVDGKERVTIGVASKPPHIPWVIHNITPITDEDGNVTGSKVDDCVFPKPENTQP